MEARVKRQAKVILREIRDLALEEGLKTSGNFDWFVYLNPYTYQIGVKRSDGRVPQEAKQSPKTEGVKVFEGSTTFWLGGFKNRFEAWGVAFFLWKRLQNLTGVVFSLYERE